MKYILFILVLACGRPEKERPYLSDPTVQWLINDMERRHDSIRRFNEISLKLDSFRLLHSLANGFGDSVWEEYYVDTINHYWGIVQKERAAQEKKVIIVREQK